MSKQKNKGEVVQVDKSVTVDITSADITEHIDVKAELNRCLKILKDLPALRRYGDDIEAMKEVAETITKVRDTL